jgi:hypothetical protein
MYVIFLLIRERDRERESGPWQTNDTQKDRLRNREKFYHNSIALNSTFINTQSFTSLRINSALDEGPLKQHRAAVYYKLFFLLLFLLLYNLHHYGVLSKGVVDG